MITETFCNNYQQIETSLPPTAVTPSKYYLSHNQ